MDEVVELQNMENVCRLCLSTDEPKSSVFSAQDSPLPLASMIQACLSIQILASDRLSTQVCEQCIKNVNQWHNYKEACLRSQEKLHTWLEKHLQSSPMVVTIKDEPVDLDFYEDNVEVISESAHGSELESSNAMEDMDHSMNNIEDQAMMDDDTSLDRERGGAAKDMVVCVKPEPQDDYDTDCTIEIESVTGSELVLNPLSTKEDRIMEADSTQKSGVVSVVNRKKLRRGPHTHFRGTRAFKQKCVHCQINLHSKYSYAKHMERFHSNKQNGDSNVSDLQDDEELVEDLEDELMSMEKEAPLTEVQQNIISQLKTFSCYSCEETFTDRNSTLTHIRQHMPDLRPYTCIACLTEFPDRSMYKLHCGASFECAMKIALVVPKHGEEKYFTCNMCLRAMPDRRQLLSHLSKHSDKQYEELVSPARSPPKLKPMTSVIESKEETARKPIVDIPHIPRPYKNGDPAHNHECDLCGMIYRYKPNMLKHKELCQRLLPEVRTSYRCIHCGMTYLVFKKFHSHILSDHKKREFTCAECFIKFPSPSEYLKHHEMHRGCRSKKADLEAMSKEASKVQPTLSTPIQEWDAFEAEMNAGRLASDKNCYSCALCNLEFATKAELAEHRNLHLKVKIYSCVICHSMFSSAGALEIHMKDHGIEDAIERNANISCVEYGSVEEDSRDSNSANLSATSDPGVNKNECDICGKIFSNTANLKRHIRNIHKTSRPHISCSHCSRMFKSKEMRDRHIELEHMKDMRSMIQCPRCPKTFTLKANLNIHFQSTHLEESYGGHKCDLCGKEFGEESSLKIHRSWHNRANSRLSINPVKKVGQNSAEAFVMPKQEGSDAFNANRPARARKSFASTASAKPNGNFQCQVCSDKFNDVTELREHLWDVHCARNKPEKAFSGGELQCELCTNIFPDKDTLNIHMQWHKANPILNNENRKSNFSCDICGKLYSSKKILYRHKKLHKATNVASMKLQSLAKHAANNQPLCNICHRVFNSNQSLQRHKLNIHSDMFSDRSQLNNVRSTPQEEPRPMDVKVEQGEGNAPFAMEAMDAGRKSVMCHVCRKFFANMSVLYKHKQVAHNKAGVTRNVGKMMVAECIPLSNNDGKVSCNICFKKFPAVPNLRQHFTVKHKNAAPKYACPADGCKLLFATQSSLKNHELSHTSMIFTCTLCGRHVFSRSAMTNHMLTVHNTVYDASSSKNYHREMDLSTYTVSEAVDATCPRCKIKYPNKRAMKIHYFKFHEGRDN